MRVNSVVDPREHVAHFYASEQELIAGVSVYVMDALTSDETAMVLATSSHITAFEAALVGAGIDLHRARTESRLITLDANDVLRRLVVDDRLHPDEFIAELAVLIPGLLATGRPLRVYGELVALLWDAGLVGAAIELEHQWNHLIERFSFRLYCGYPANSMAATDNGADAVRRACDCHTRVTGSAAPTAGLEGAEASRVFPWDLVAVASSRRFVTDMLMSWDLGHVVEDGTLIVSELATNAVMHARSEFTVLLSYEAGTLCISVRDDSAAVPSVKNPPGTVIAGRGLRLVAAIAQRWGTDRDGRGKLVWAELPT